MNKPAGKKEFSKCLAVTVVSVGVLEIAAYYTAVFLGLECDPVIAATATTQCLGAVLSYCLYQFGLKNSRNKYGVDAEGQPFRKYEESEECEDEA